MPAGVKKASPGRGATQLTSRSISPEIAALRNCSRATDSRKPRAIFASGAALTMYHISVLPRLSWCLAAYASSGCTWNESAWSVWMNLIRRGSSGSAVYHTSLPQGRSTTFGCSLNRAAPLLLTYEFLDPIQPARQLLHGRRVTYAHIVLPAG